jgi:cardiolipin synthase
MPIPRNLPNIISLCRIALMPVLLVLAWQGREKTFLACLIVTLVSDIADGQVARRWHLQTELGARLDSWADVPMYFLLPLAAYWLRPDLVVTERVAYFTTLGSFLLPIAWGFLKFGRLTSYHTFLVAVAAYLLGASVILLFAHGPTLPFRFAVAVLVIAELEEIAITAILPAPRSNVRSFRTALAIRREAFTRQITPAA